MKSKMPLIECLSVKPHRCGDGSGSPIVHQVVNQLLLAKPGSERLGPTVSPGGEFLQDIR